MHANVYPPQGDANGEGGRRGGAVRMKGFTMTAYHPAKGLPRRATRKGGQHGFGGRKTDAALLCLLALVFPSFCPIPLGRDQFFTVDGRAGLPWRVGPWTEHTCFRGYGVTSRGFALGPLSLVKKEWSYSRGEPDPEHRALRVPSIDAALFIARGRSRH